MQTCTWWRLKAFKLLIDQRDNSSSIAKASFCFPFLVLSTHPSVVFFQNNRFNKREWTAGIIVEKHVVFFLCQRYTNAEVLVIGISCICEVCIEEESES